MKVQVCWSSCYHVWPGKIGWEAIMYMNMRKSSELFVTGPEQIKYMYISKVQLLRSGICNQSTPSKVEYLQQSLLCSIVVAIDSCWSMYHPSWMWYWWADARGSMPYLLPGIILLSGSQGKHYKTNLWTEPEKSLLPFQTDRILRWSCAAGEGRGWWKGLLPCMSISIPCLCCPQQLLRSSHKGVVTKQDNAAIAPPKLSGIVKAGFVLEWVC